MAKYEAEIKQFFRDTINSNPNSKYLTEEEKEDALKIVLKEAEMIGLTMEKLSSDLERGVQSGNSVEKQFTMLGNLLNLRRLLNH